MSLSSGARLGPYEILFAIGAGGMGEVYRARDTRLERTVAIKVLPEHLSSSAEVRQRFEREAKTISQLSHPHICALYDVGNQEGVEYLVMEFLEGETLADRLAKGSLPLEGERKPQVFLQTPFLKYPAAFSPDGRWLAYGSEESGNFHIYVTSFPRPGRKWQVSTESGGYAYWSADEKEIVYHGYSGRSGRSRSRRRETPSRSARPSLSSSSRDLPGRAAPSSSQRRITSGFSSWTMARRPTRS